MSKAKTINGLIFVRMCLSNYSEDRVSPMVVRVMLKEGSSKSRLSILVLPVI